MNRSELIEISCGHLLASLREHPLVAHEERMNLTALRPLIEGFVDSTGEKGVLLRATEGQTVAVMLHEVQTSLFRRHFYVKYAFTIEASRRRGLASGMVEELLGVARRSGATHISGCAQDWNVASRHLIDRFRLAAVEDNLALPLSTIRVSPPADGSFVEVRPGLPHLTDVLAQVRDAIIRAVHPYSACCDEGNPNPTALLDALINACASPMSRVFFDQAGGAEPVFAWCEVVETTFKDTVEIRHLAAPPLQLATLLAHVTAFAARLGLKEVTITVPIGEVDLSHCLRDLGFQVCDTYYARRL